MFHSTKLNLMWSKNYPFLYSKGQESCSWFTWGEAIGSSQGLLSAHVTVFASFFPQPHFHQLSMRQPSEIGLSANHFQKQHKRTHVVMGISLGSWWPRNAKSLERTGTQVPWHWLEHGRGDVQYSGISTLSPCQDRKQQHVSTPDTEHSFCSNRPTLATAMACWELRLGTKVLYHRAARDLQACSASATVKGRHLSHCHKEF